MNEKEQFELFTSLFDLTVILDVGVLCTIACALYACLRYSLIKEHSLSYYWAPIGAPLSKWHLPVFLFKVIMCGYTALSL